MNFCVYEFSCLTIVVVYELSYLIIVVDYEFLCLLSYFVADFLFTAKHFYLLYEKKNYRLFKILVVVVLHSVFKQLCSKG